MKTKELLTVVIFAGSLSLQGFGLQPAVRPCCALKLNPQKSDVATTDQKRKLPKAEEEHDQQKND